MRRGGHRGLHRLLAEPGRGGRHRLTGAGSPVTDRWFDTFTHERVDARLGDVRAAELGSDFDFVVGSFVLHHLPERAEVVARLAKALRPGGWLLVSEPDISLSWTRSGPRDLDPRLNAVLRRFAELGVDYECGLKTVGALHEVGLSNVDACVWTPLVARGTAGRLVMENALPVVRDVATGRGWATDEEMTWVQQATAAPDLLAGPWPTVLCWGQRSR